METYMKQRHNNLRVNTQFQLSSPVQGNPLKIGAGFQALSFKHDQFNGLMDPLVMLDHYTMTHSTFGAHPHAGMSAVSILFEDSEGVFNNKDSLGNDIDLQPGDAYWLKAGAGAVHDEKPTSGSRTHGLQIFVNLPKAYKQDAPASIHVPATSMPVIKGEGYRVRVIFGDSNGTQGATSPALPFTALDTYLESGGSYEHEVSSEQSVLVYVVTGQVDILIDEQTVNLPKGRTIAFHTGASAKVLKLASTNSAHVAVLQGSPIREQFVQKGPFVMSDLEELNKVSAAYESGLLGAISVAD